jgi:heterodisulfide reductase subunit C
MSGSIDDKDRATRIELELWREHAEELADKDSWTEFCQECGACIESCPAAKYGDGFNPREIILKVRYGLAGKLLIERSVLWQCFKCYTCYESCPQPLKPVEAVALLKELLVDMVHADHGSGPQDA